MKKIILQLQLLIILTSCSTTLPQPDSLTSFNTSAAGTRIACQSTQDFDIYYQNYQSFTKNNKDRYLVPCDDLNDLNITYSLNVIISSKEESQNVYEASALSSYLELDFNTQESNFSLNGRAYEISSFNEKVTKITYKVYEPGYIGYNPFNYCCYIYANEKIAIYRGLLNDDFNINESKTYLDKIIENYYNYLSIIYSN